jgi:hypothetical protein
MTSWSSSLTVSVFCLVTRTGNSVRHIIIRQGQIRTRGLVGTTTTPPLPHRYGTNARPIRRFDVDILDWYVRPMHNTHNTLYSHHVPVFASVLGAPNLVRSGLGGSLEARQSTADSNATMYPDACMIECGSIDQVLAVSFQRCKAIHLSLKDF